MKKVNYFLVVCTTCWCISAFSADTLVPGASLGAGHSMASSNGEHVLVMQTDGNLTLYNVSPDGDMKARWSSGTDNNPGAEVVMQTDGNLVVYSNGQAVWSSGTDSNPGAYLSLQNDGNLVVYSSAQNPLWNAGTANLVHGLAPGQWLFSGQSITSPDGEYQLTMGTDGNLVLSEVGEPGAIWASWTQGNPGAELIMGADGNLVLVSSGGSAVWATWTMGHPGAKLLLQDDRNLVVYYQNQSIWATGTQCTLEPTYVWGGHVANGYTQWNNSCNIYVPIMLELEPFLGCIDPPFCSTLCYVPEENIQSTQTGYEEVCH